MIIFLQIPLAQVTVPSTSSQQRNHHVGGASSESPPPLCKTLVGKGASSLVGGFRHAAVLFDEQTELKHVRAKALYEALLQRRRPPLKGM